MIALFNLRHYLILLVLYVAPALKFLRDGDRGALVFVGSAVGFLFLFSIVCRIAAIRKVPNYQEVIDRTKTWYWMIGVFLVTMAFNRGISFAALAFMSFSALKEYFSLLPMYYPDARGRTLLRRHDRRAILLCYLSIPIMFYLAYVKWYNLYILIVPVYIALLIPFLLVMENQSENFLVSASVILWGVILFVFLLGHSAFLVNLSPLLLFYGIFLTEARDVVVYMFGKATAPVIARHPDSAFWKAYDIRIAPQISPKKNVGSALLTIATIMLMSLAYQPFLPAFPLGRMSVGVSLLIGALVGVMGMVGDLVGSAFKRDLGVKDSGTVLPGHGGVIDRIGSLCFTLPVIFHLCYFLYFPAFHQRGL
ncbi:MAG: Phosphatidate cytidylyltransferase [Verrucomicrobia bacterium ADurb.Bin345]|nr:MAG: Phosphatidate cytidylyltransferase [Verrucomicrobia bacterium ADurb.Bin345]